jgi:methionyl-tRNA formyltransferase
LKLWAAQLVPVPSCLGGAGGTVLAIEGERLLVSCGASVIAITEVQRAGGKRMPVSAWLAGGNHGILGEVLGASSALS